MREKSLELFQEAQKYIPGGVNSPVRAFRSVGIHPAFIAKAKDAYIYDADGNEYIDYITSWGPMIVGHANEEVREAVTEALGRGASYGAPTAAEVTMAKMVVEAFPAMEMVRMVNSGTEATMSAIRLARAYTKKDKIIKFAGCYHGHADNLLVKAGSGVATLGLPDSPGVPALQAQNTLTVPYNDLEALKECLKANAGEVACVIIEPVACNMGVVLPKKDYLQGVRDLTRQYDALLIFDEVITGFRLGYSGAEGYFQVSPDLTCLGKIIGGGLPVGAYGGKKEIMQMIAPAGPVYQAGTLSGNPLAMAAGIKTLEILHRPGTYEELEKKSALLEKGFRENLQRLGLGYQLNRLGSLLCLFFSEEPVTDYATAKKSDTEKFAAYFRAMLQEGIYLAPAQFEAMFVSLKHTEEDIEKTIAANFKALEKINTEER
ncbi:MAG: glutamate-1-semialdehyde 2,1-aminomutase [bacterium]